jgi:lipoate-protein ligase A
MPPPDAGAATPPGRWLPTTCLGGSWQMALDAWLLEQPRAAFRLYRWQRPTLSLGRHQRRIPAHWEELAAAGSLALVRRPSGGRAVLHGGDLTYALVWPEPPRRRVQAYAAASAWLLEAFRRLGQPLTFGTAAAAGGLASPNCFALGTAADLVHADGSKRVGSAQLWRAGRLLQHGAIQLAPCPHLWRQLFGTSPPSLPPLPCEGEALERRLLEAAREALPFRCGLDWAEPLRAPELAAVALHHLRGGAQEPVPGVETVSPEATMLRTTWGRASPSG